MEIRQNYLLESRVVNSIFTGSVPLNFEPSSSMI
jgi:hypothetical protein